MSWFIYILFCDQKTFYIGLTDNLGRRLNEHQSGYPNYTKKFSDIRLVYKEKFTDRKEAEKREQQLKKWTVAKKKALIENNKTKLIELSKNTDTGKV